MKTVFNSALDVMHLFAEKSQNTARCNSVFFEGNKIYSYGHHFILGEFIENNAIILNDSNYSVTTSKHYRQLGNATRQYKQFLKSDIDAKIVLQTVESNQKKLLTAKKKELYILPSIAIFEALNEFIEFTKDKTIRKTIEYKTIKKIVSKLNDAEYIEKLAKKAETDKLKADRLKADRLKADIIKFENHEIRTLYNTSEDYVRLSNCSEYVETSQGVKVTVKEAKVLYQLIESGKDIKGFKISNYTVISLNGTLTIGCHKINIQSMHKIGKKL